MPETVSSGRSGGQRKPVRARRGPTARACRAPSRRRTRRRARGQAAAAAFRPAASAKFPPLKKCARRRRHFPQHSGGSRRACRTPWTPYDLWTEQEYLETTPGASISYEFIAERLKDVFEDYHVTKIAFDRWNYPHLRPWLGKVGFSEQLLERTFVEFGQGFKSMSPALRDLESLVLGRKLRHGNHPVLTVCMANATVERDAAGNRKLSKKRSSGRIDGAVALAMAIAAAPAAWTAKVDIAALIG